MIVLSLVVPMWRWALCNDNLSRSPSARSTRNLRPTRAIGGANAHVARQPPQHGSHLRARRADACVIRRVAARAARATTAYRPHGAAPVYRTAGATKLIGLLVGGPIERSASGLAQR
jgi:hypothetical protein